MGKLNDIRQKLAAGSTTKQLIEQGYPKSSVFAAAKQIKSTSPDLPAVLASDELRELRQRRDIIRLQKEIAELEAVKEKLPERIAALEKKILELRSILNDAVDTALSVCLRVAGVDPAEANEYADGWVEKNIKAR